jgi:hypothetical protein
MTDYTPLLEKSSLNMNFHKRLRHQKSIFLLFLLIKFLFLAVLFQDRPETFNGKSSDKRNNLQLKECVNKYVNGSLSEEAFNNILKENNIDPNINSVSVLLRF